MAIWDIEEFNRLWQEETKRLIGDDDFAGLPEGLRKQIWLNVILKLLCRDYNYIIWEKKTAS